MRIAYTILITTSISILLSGCELYRAITFAEAPDSGHPGGRVELQLIGPGRDANQTIELPPRISSYCTTPPGAAITAVPAPLVLAAGSIGYNLLTQEVMSYLARKKQAFSRSYAARLNVASFDLTRSRCLRLIRVLEDTVVAETLMGLHPLSDSSFIIRPLYVNLKKAAALTRNDDPPQVKMEIGVGFAVIHPDTLLQKQTVLVSQSVLLPNVAVGSAVILSEDPFQEANPLDTGAIPQFDGKTATVALAITETGTGAEAFDAFSVRFGENAKILGAALGKVLELRLSD